MSKKVLIFDWKFSLVDFSQVGSWMHFGHFFASGLTSIYRRWTVFPCASITCGLRRILMKLFNKLLIFIPVILSWDFQEFWSWNFSVTKKLWKALSCIKSHRLSHWAFFSANCVRPNDYASKTKEQTTLSKKMYKDMQVLHISCRLWQIIAEPIANINGALWELGDFVLSVFQHSAVYWLV